MPPSPAFYTPSLFTSFLNSRVLFLVFCASKNTKLFTVHMLYLGLNVSDQLKNSFFPPFMLSNSHTITITLKTSLSADTLSHAPKHTCMFIHPDAQKAHTELLLSSTSLSLKNGATIPLSSDLNPELLLL